MRLFLRLLILWLAILGSQALPARRGRPLTDPLEVQALQDLYKSLNQPRYLHRWKLNGGDPCNESWFGIICRGSSVTAIKLKWCGLTGNLGPQLSNLRNLTYLDLSFNYIGGEIPALPSSLEGLRLNHNNFSGPLPNVFTGLEHLGLMDLTNNSFTGDLPSSFRSLKSITNLYLEGNKFTGSLDCLVGLPLAVLDIRGNDFDNVPEEIRSIGYKEIIPEELQAELEYWCKTLNITKNCPWDEDAGEPTRYRLGELALRYEGIIEVREIE